MDYQSLFLGGQGQTPADYANQTQYQNNGQIQSLINQGLNGVNARQTPQNINPYAGQQAQQISQLQGVASGQQQGAGELAVQRQVQNALAGQQSMAAMNRGAGAGMGNLSAARNSAAIGLSGAGQSQQAALQDQQTAQGQLSTAFGQQNQMQLANLNAQLQAMGMNDQARLGYLSQFGQMDANQLNAQMGAYSAGQQNKGIAGALISSGGQALGAYLGRPPTPSGS